MTTVFFSPTIVTQASPMSRRIVSFVFVLLLPSLTAGMDGTQRPTADPRWLHGPTRPVEIGQLMSSPGAFKGRTVFDGFGYHLGRVEIVVVNRKQTTAYVVIDANFGKRLIPVPHDSIEMTSTGEFVLHTDRRRLASAPSYPKGSRPAWSYYWTARIAEFWALPPRPLTETGFPLPETPSGTAR